MSIIFKSFSKRLVNSWCGGIMAWENQAFFVLNKWEEHVMGGILGEMWKYIVGNNKSTLHRL
ncbi:hypothetical protein GCM10008933_39290 [Paenibacillus motobuensis]|uniref:Uncharacterized protein n=1 Tax=Paenibacillus motobuensis TaxID=295324 RepID=A0ABN0YQJ2_9BACL